MTRLLIFVVCLLPLELSALHDSTKAVASRRIPFPQFVPIQFAGNIGFLSTGLGYESRRQNFQIALVYGYVPSSVAGVDAHLISAKNTLHVLPFRLKERWIIPYSSLTASVEVGGRSFLTLPDNMPASYYDWPKSLHFLLSAGVKTQFEIPNRTFSSIEVFAELNTVDVYLWYKLISKHVELTDVVSVALGVNIKRR